MPLSEPRGGGPTDIADLFGGVDTDILTKQGGIWQGSSPLGLSFDGAILTNLGRIRAGAGTLTLPGFAFAIDPDTGLIRLGADFLGTDIGGVIGTSWSETLGRILVADQYSHTLTASTTQTQGQQSLFSSYNEISVVANPNDVVTAPSVARGAHLVIINNGANVLQVFPAAGDDIGAGVNASITIAAGALGIWIGKDTVTWHLMFNQSTAAPMVFPEFQFLADNGLVDTGNVDWAVSPNAADSVDGNNASLRVRKFDASTEQGAGFFIKLPANADGSAGGTDITFTTTARADSAPPADRFLRVKIYRREIPDNAAIGVFNATTFLNITIPANEFFQVESFTISFSSMGLTPDTFTQFEITRVAPSGGATNLAGDWDLLSLKVSFS